MDHTWTRHADVNNSLSLTDTVKGTRHKRIVFDRVGKTDKLCTCESALIASSFGCVFYDSSDMGHYVHVDPRARRRCVDGRTQTLGAGECGGNRIKKLNFGRSRAFLDEGGVAANEIHTDCSGGVVDGARDLHKIATQPFC